MKIVTTQLSVNELKQIAPEFFGDMVKAVVDVDQEIIAVNAELHSDLEALLLKNGSQQKSLWGINLYPEVSGDDFVEFDSMINLRPSQGNRSRGVESKEIQQRIRAVVHKKIVQ